MKWNELSDMEQVYLYWEFIAANPDCADYTFEEFEVIASETLV